MGDEPPRRNLDYLLEDDPPSTRGRLYFGLLLVVLIAVLLVWHWRRDGYPWAGTPRHDLPIASPSASSDNSAAPSPSATPAESPVATPSAATPATTETIDIAPPQPGAQSKVADSATPQTKTAGTQTPESHAPDPGTTGQTPPPPSASSNTDQSAATQDDAVAPAVAPVPAKKAETPVAKSSATKEQSASSLPATDDKLVADGERYLYGTGVPQSCDRARKNLFTAASNAKAQSLLGAMYATGHCVNRDLPSAYRWFAKALHQEPGNERVARDLEVLWKQMTPAERQAAVRGPQ